MVVQSANRIGDGFRHPYREGSAHLYPHGWKRLGSGPGPGLGEASSAGDINDAVLSGKRFVSGA